MRTVAALTPDDFIGTTSGGSGGKGSKGNVFASDVCSNVTIVSGHNSCQYGNTGDIAEIGPPTDPLPVPEPNPLLILMPAIVSFTGIHFTRRRAR